MPRKPSIPHPNQKDAALQKVLQALKERVERIDLALDAVKPQRVEVTPRTAVKATAPAPAPTKEPLPAPVTPEGPYLIDDLGVENPATVTFTDNLVEFFWDDAEPLLREGFQDFRVDFYDGATLLRTVYTVDARVTYSLIQMTADAGGPVRELTVKLSRRLWDGRSSPMSEITVTNVAPVFDQSPGVTVQSKTSTSVTLNIHATDDGDPNNFTRIVATATGGTPRTVYDGAFLSGQHQVTDLLPDNEYTFDVTIGDALGDAATESVVETTDAPQAGDKPSVVKEEGYNYITLDWTLPEDVDYARVYRDGVVVFEGYVSGFVDENLDQTVSYSYQVAFVTDSFEGTLSDPVAAQPTGEIVQNARFLADVTIEGDLFVNGTTTQVNSEDTQIGDNVITLNFDEPNAGVTKGTAGIEIDRGTLTNSALIFNESLDRWEVDNGDGVKHGLYHEDFHPEADKWTTPRTITLDGDLSGSVLLDGSTDVTLSAEVENDSHTHSIYVQKAGDTMTGTLVINNTLALRMEGGLHGITYNDGGGNFNIRNNNYFDSGLGANAYSATAKATHLLFSDTSTAANLQIKTYPSGTAGTALSGGNIFTFNSDGNELQINGNRAFHSAYHPNADKWTTARTLTIDGDADGAVALDGSANVTLTLDVTQAANADTLDTLDSTQFLRSDIADTAEGVITFNKRPNISGAGQADTALLFTNNVVGAQNWLLDALDSGNFRLSGSGSGSNELVLKYGGGFDFRDQNNALALTMTAAGAVDVNSGLFTVGGNTVWHAGNDGAGSGLDADTTDGLHAIDLKQQIDRLNLNSTDDLDAIATHGWYAWTGGSVPANAPQNYGILAQVTDGVQKNQFVFGGSGSGNLYVRRADGGTFYPWTRFYNDNYHPSADDADTVDGLHASSFVRGDDVDEATQTINVTSGDFIVKSTATGSETNVLWFDGSVPTVYIGGQTVPVTLRGDLVLQSGHDIATDGVRFANVEVTAGTDGSVAFDSSEGLLVHKAVQPGNVHTGADDYLVLDASNISAGSGISITGGKGSGGAPVTFSVDGTVLTDADRDDFVNVTGDTMTGDLNIDKQSLNIKALFGAGSGGWARGVFLYDPGDARFGGFGILGSADTPNYVFLGAQDTPWGNYALKIDYNTRRVDFAETPIVVGAGGGDIWHEGNDGAGSGLDADTTDGEHATELKQLISRGVLTSADSLTALADGWYAWSSNVPTGTPDDFMAMVQVTDNQKVQMAFGHSGSAELYIRRADGGTFYPWTRFWNDGNDGPGSGLDADTVDGLHAADLTPNDATITISANSGVSGGGSFTLNQAANDTISINHADTSSQASVNNSGDTVIQDVTLDTYGHVTGLASKTLTIPAAPNDATITLSAGGGITGGGNFTTDQGANETLTFSHADTSSQGNYIGASGGVVRRIDLDTYGHVTLIEGMTVGPYVDSVTGGNAIDVSTIFSSPSIDPATRSVTVHHADTSSQGSVNNGGNTVIQDVTLDAYGHVTGLASRTIDLGVAGHLFAWASFKVESGTGTSGTITLYDSGNVSSVTAIDKGNNLYHIRITFSNSAANTSYGYMATRLQIGSGIQLDHVQEFNTSYVEFLKRESNNEYNVQILSSG